MSFILIYTTNKDKKEAEAIAKHLLSKKLVACANIFPIRSIYSWKTQIAENDETVSILKTRKENYGKVKKEIERLHSYKVPCIINLSVSANKSYEDWIEKSTILNSNNNE